MKIETVNSIENAEFIKAFEIYNYSFPEFEKRTLPCQKRAFENADYRFYAAKDDDGNVLGLITTWERDNFIYIEHLAVDKSERGRGIGSKMLGKIISSSSKPLILEIDPPVDDISRRRKCFYDRLGFIKNNHKHRQIPLHKNDGFNELVLMTHPEINDEIYNEFISYLENTVMLYSEQ